MKKIFILLFLMLFLSFGLAQTDTNIDANNINSDSWVNNNEVPLFSDISNFFNGIVEYLINIPNIVAILLIICIIEALIIFSNYIIQVITSGGLKTIIMLLFIFFIIAVITKLLNVW